MSASRRAGHIRIGLTLIVILASLILLINQVGHDDPEPTGSAAGSGEGSGDGAVAPAEPTATEPPAPPPWLRPLAAGEKPPQFVLFSFDGAGSHEHWQRVLSISRRVNAHVTGFLSGIYLLSNEERGRYTGPGHRPGKASIAFGGSAEEVRTRIDDLNAAIRDGHEIGTHYNGHFCRDAAPGAGAWSTDDWNSELDQFFRFVDDARARGLRLDPATVKGGRTPCLEGRWDQLFPALAGHGMTYDTSHSSNGISWPAQLSDGIWEFPLPGVTVPVIGRKTIMMDYNLMVNLGKRPPATLRAATLETYWAAYRAAFDGNRAPIVVGNHFNDWASGAFNGAMEDFLGSVCAEPDTVCATHTEVINWMGLQDPAVLDQLRAMPSAGI